MKKDVVLRDYQIEALNNFENNGWRGILEMATGTGKTFTGLAISKAFMNYNNKIFLIILVPFTHLVDQWINNCEIFGYRNVIKCFGTKKSWLYELEGLVKDFNLGFTNIQCVISTYKSASSIEFNESISKLKSGSFIIGDECHYFGIKGLRNNMLGMVEGRLGLSATPDRWWDEDGTEFLRDYFGATIFSYSMKEAIKNGILTEYKYHPIVVDLTTAEKEKYEKYSKMIVRLANSKEHDTEEIADLCRRRSAILSKAINKKQILIDIFNIKIINEVSHTLVYCAPGEINELTLELSNLGYRVHRFNSDVPMGDRTKILERFDEGLIQILVAIKCLDEGVDIPSTKEAYFLASTSNPREFIQRRGRVLRKYQGKNISNIYDFIVIPNGCDYELYKAIVSKELPRFAEFTQYAINGFLAREVIKDDLKAHALEHLMDKLPWDVYKEISELKEI